MPTPASLLPPPLPSSSSAPAGARVHLSEVLAALSHALDLTEGQPVGHTLRACLIGMRLAEELGLDAESRSALYYALLLKDAGCSSNAARMAALFGSDDRAVKPRMKLVDWHRRAQLALRTATTVGMGSGLASRVRHLLAIARTPDMTRELIQVRCDRGAEIARRLGFPGATADAIRSLDEHWCGLGYPIGLAGDEIPLLARIASLAQVVEVYHDREGLTVALDVARERRGSWFDPALVDRVIRWRDDGAFWRTVRGPEAVVSVIGAEPADRVRVVDATGLDEVARAFADIIDAKSPYTFHHSTNVAAYAERAAHTAGLPRDEAARLRRAGLLHDIGKLGVSNLILDKPGALTGDERAEVMRHPVHTWEILSRVGAFAHFARTASLHHEKLDGSGYPWRVRGEDLDAPARLLVVADIYEALTADRPYRAGMPRAKAIGILHDESGTKLCARAVDALEAATA